jgi:3-oxoacyl-[acyl-carrier protein] reductase
VSVSLEGKAALVTGAGAGLGRAEALALAAAGAAVVVNDYDKDAAHAVVDEITGAGGRATAAAGDVSSWAVAEELVTTAIQEYGQLDILVNNAGVLRDRTIFNISEDEWDTVIGVHLKGHAGTTRFATAHWRERSKAAGGPVYGRVVNTASEAFLFGSAGQPNYAAAKAGIVALTVATHRACERYGVRANAICPRARTGMTVGVFGEAPEGDDPLSVDRVAPLVTYLSSPASEQVSGQVFVVYGGMVVLASAPGIEQRFDAPGGAWTAEGLADEVGPYFAQRDNSTTFAADGFSRL